MVSFALQETAIQPGFTRSIPFQHFSADQFPVINPIHWMNAHFAVGGWSPLQRLSGMLTAHMTRIAPHNGFTWHPHRGLEIYTWVLEGTLYHEDTTGGKGEIRPGELQRMFSGDYIEHMEMNYTDDPVRVIQIWFIADRHHRGLPPHYQQAGGDLLPARTIGDAAVYSLIGGESPMDQHMTGRLTAAMLPAGGSSTLEAPGPDEDLFVYVTEGAGTAAHRDRSTALGQYDVLLARPNVETVTIQASASAPLHFLNFYLPSFLD